MAAAACTRDACHTSTGGDSVDQAEFVVRDHPVLGPGVRQVKLECSHGRTFAVLLPGSKPISDQVVLDLLGVRHQRGNACHCTTALRPGILEVGIAADALDAAAELRPSTSTAAIRSDA